MGKQLGNANAPYNQTDSKFYNSICANGANGGVSAAYSQIVADMQEHGTIPSFASTDRNAAVKELSWDGDKYVVKLMTAGATTVYAASDPLAVINNLSNFIFGLIRAVGLILLGWGIVQVGLSLQSHDPSQRSNGFLTLAGGVIITLAKEILILITG